MVAHPPCNLWVNLAKVNYIRWGGSTTVPATIKAVLPPRWRP